MPQEGGLGGTIPHRPAPCFRAQGEATGLAQGCMLSSALHGLRLILSPVTPPPLSPQMCSELDVRDCRVPSGSCSQASLAGLGLFPPQTGAWSRGLAGHG